MHNVFNVECDVALLYFCHSFTYISTKSVTEQLQSARKSFFSDFIVNTLDKDQSLIQIK